MIWSLKMSGLKANIQATQMENLHFNIQRTSFNKSKSIFV
jgi:hypothetical protein